MSRRAQIAIVHPAMGFGGSEAPVLWTIAALKDLFDVTLISMSGVDLDRLNAYYGTALSPEDFSLRRAPLPAGLRGSSLFAGLKGSFLERYVRRVAPEFDLLISCYGPMDFGKSGIQMIADLSFVEEWRFSLHPGVHSWKRWWYGQSPVRAVYQTIRGMVAQSSPEGWKRNLTLANSDWTAGLMQQRYGMESKTLYPPVTGDFPTVDFQERENGFVCLGRVVPEKRVDAIIAILAEVRQKGHDVHLHILGGLDDSPFCARVKKLAEGNAEWLFLEGWAMGQRKHALLSGHRYGIHARENEPFGIAVGEMVNAGCIVFVPQGGGQVEIVDHPALTFKDEADAVVKISSVLADVAQQEQLRRHLRQRANRFSPDSFQEQVRQIVKGFLQEQPELLSCR